MFVATTPRRIPTADLKVGDVIRLDGRRRAAIVSEALGQRGPLASYIMVKRGVLSGSRYGVSGDTREVVGRWEDAPAEPVTLTASPALVDMIAEHTGETHEQVLAAMARTGWQVAPAAQALAFPLGAEDAVVALWRASCSAALTEGGRPLGWDVQHPRSLTVRYLERQVEAHERAGRRAEATRAWRELVKAREAERAADEAYADAELAGGEWTAEETEELYRAEQAAMAAREQTPAEAERAQADTDVVRPTLTVDRPTPAEAKAIGQEMLAAHRASMEQVLAAEAHAEALMGARVVLPDGRHGTVVDSAQVERFPLTGLAAVRLDAQRASDRVWALGRDLRLADTGEQGTLADVRVVKGPEAGAAGKLIRSGGGLATVRLVTRRGILADVIIAEAWLEPITLERREAGPPRIAGGGPELTAWTPAERAAWLASEREHDRLEEPPLYDRTVIDALADWA